MSRVPIRVRLTAAFALAMALLLVGAGAFVYQRLDSDLKEAVDDTLEQRADSVVGSTSRALEGAAPAESDEGFAQIVAGEQLLAAVGGTREPVLTVSEAQRALTRAVLLERAVPGVDGATRILARPAPDGVGESVLVVGASLEDRDETLSNLIASFAIGGPVAVLLASLLGYALATAGLRPIEAMRERAQRVSFEEGADPLPLPAAHDEVRRLGETLNEMLARLRGSFDRERQFVADASHELRSPIAVIKAELDNGLRDRTLDTETRESLVAASEECDRLAQLADDLLVLARSGDGAVPVRREPLAVRTLLAEARTRFAARAAERGREVRLDVEGDPGLDADPLRLRQALGNLIDNALRHGGGSVLLRARNSPGWVEIDVADEGPGFAVGLGDQAFERFTRGDSARARGGAGLGLSIVRAIAEAHGGSAELVDGENATVRLRLPAAGNPSQGHLSEAT